MKRSVKTESSTKELPIQALNSFFKRNDFAFDDRWSPQTLSSFYLRVYKLSNLLIQQGANSLIESDPENIPLVGRWYFVNERLHSRNDLIRMLRIKKIESNQVINPPGYFEYKQGWFRYSAVRIISLKGKASKELPEILGQLDKHYLIHCFKPCKGDILEDENNSNNSRNNSLSSDFVMDQQCIELRDQRYEKNQLDSWQQLSISMEKNKQNINYKDRIGTNNSNNNYLPNRQNDTQLELIERITKKINSQEQGFQREVQGQQQQTQQLQQGDDQENLKIFQNKTVKNSNFEKEQQESGIEDDQISGQLAACVDTYKESLNEAVKLIQQQNKEIILYKNELNLIRTSRDNNKQNNNTSERSCINNIVQIDDDDDNSEYQQNDNTDGIGKVNGNNNFNNHNIDSDKKVSRLKKVIRKQKRKYERKIQNQRSIIKNMEWMRIRRTQIRNSLSRLHQVQVKQVQQALVQLKMSINIQFNQQQEEKELQQQQYHELRYYQQSRYLLKHEYTTGGTQVHQEQVQQQFHGEEVQEQEILGQSQNTIKQPLGQIKLQYETNIKVEQQQSQYSQQPQQQYSCSSVKLKQEVMESEQQEEEQLELHEQIEDQQQSQLINIESRSHTEFIEQQNELQEPIIEEEKVNDKKDIEVLDKDINKSKEHVQDVQVLIEKDLISLVKSNQEEVVEQVKQYKNLREGEVIVIEEEEGEGECDDKVCQKDQGGNNDCKVVQDLSENGLNIKEEIKQDQQQQGKLEVLDVSHTVNDSNEKELVVCCNSSSSQNGEPVTVQDLSVSMKQEDKEITPSQISMEQQLDNQIKPQNKYLLHEIDIQDSSSGIIIEGLEQNGQDDKENNCQSNEKQDKNEEDIKEDNCGKGFNLGEVEKENNDIEIIQVEEVHKNNHIKEGESGGYQEGDGREKIKGKIDVQNDEDDGIIINEIVSEKENKDKDFNNQNMVFEFNNNEQQLQQQKEQDYIELVEKSSSIEQEQQVEEQQLEQQSQQQCTSQEQQVIETEGNSLAQNSIDRKYGIVQEKENENIQDIELENKENPVINDGSDEDSKENQVIMQEQIKDTIRDEQMIPERNIIQQEDNSKDDQDMLLKEVEVTQEQLEQPKPIGQVDNIQIKENNIQDALPLAESGMVNIIEEQLVQVKQGMEAKQQLMEQKQQQLSSIEKQQDEHVRRQKDSKAQLVKEQVQDQVSQKQQQQHLEEKNLLEKQQKLLQEQEVKQQLPQQLVLQYQYKQQQQYKHKELQSQYHKQEQSQQKAKLRSQLQFIKQLEEQEEDDDGSSSNFAEEKEKKTNNQFSLKQYQQQRSENNHGIKAQKVLSSPQKLQYHEIANQTQQILNLQQRQSVSSAMAEEQDQNELNSRISLQENPLAQHIQKPKQKDQQIDTQRQLRSSSNNNNNNNLYLLRHSTRFSEKNPYSLSQTQSSTIKSEEHVTLQDEARSSKQYGKYQKYKTQSQ